MRDGDVERLEELRDYDDPRTIEEMRLSDTDFEEGEITEVEQSKYRKGWTVTRDGGLTGFVKFVEGGPVPEVGKTLRVYGQFGHPFYGFDIDGENLYYETPWERFAKRMTMLAEMDRKKREDFAEHKDRLDRDYESLPGPLRARIDRFRSKSEGFRVNGESYELFCCTEAAKFLRNVQAAVDCRSYDDEVNAFWAMPIGDGVGKRRPGTVFEEEPKTDLERYLIWAWALNDKTYDYGKVDGAIPQKDVLDYDDGHSGNTFGGAVSLALALARGEDV